MTHIASMRSPPCVSQHAVFGICSMQRATVITTMLDCIMTPYVYMCTQTRHKHRVCYECVHTHVPTLVAGCSMVCTSCHDTHVYICSKPTSTSMCCCMCDHMCEHATVQALPRDKNPKNTKKNVHSRAWHAARSQALRDGKCTDEAKDDIFIYVQLHIITIIISIIIIIIGSSITITIIIIIIIIIIICQIALQVCSQHCVHQQASTCSFCHMSLSAMSALHVSHRMLPGDCSRRCFEGCARLREPGLREGGLRLPGGTWKEA